VATFYQLIFDEFLPTGMTSLYPVVILFQKL